MGKAMIGVIAAAIAAWLMASDPIPQDPSYHAMADRRAVLGIPNGLDVISNLGFAVVGLLGLAAVRGGRFADPWTRRPYALLFVGSVLTAVGSSYYHLAPDNARLVWDRVPMTLAFMGLLTAVVAERVSVPVAKRSFLPLVMAGIASVVYWYATETRGHGDLRPYALVQFGSLLAIAAILAFHPGRWPATRFLAAGLGAYVVAKALEGGDAAVLGLTGVVSGHTLKHVVAAAGIACIAADLRMRPLPNSSTEPGRGAPAEVA
jgi:hypothetical protein